MRSASLPGHKYSIELFGHHCNRLGKGTGVATGRMQENPDQKLAAMASTAPMMAVIE